MAMAIIPGSLLAVIVSMICVTTAIAEKKSRFNVLFIMSDDLRPELGCYVKKSQELRHLNQQIKTPNIDQLAERSVLFTHAFAQYPLCNPSRTSMLTGRSPQVTKVVGNIQSFKTAGNFTTLPGYFKQNGYTTLHTGKIFHESTILDFSDQWHTPLEKNYNQKLKKFAHGRDPEMYRKKIWSVLDDANESGNKLYYDDLRVEQAIHYLKQLRNEGQKKFFFMGVGFLKNHLPLEAPQKFFDMYPPGKIKPPSNYHKPDNFPDQALIGFCEMSNYEDARRVGLRPYSKEKAIGEDLTRDLRRAYYSTVSWVDHNIGRLLKGLKDTGFDQNTIVVLTADHGYHLGENNHWCKLKLLDLDLRVPLLIHVPGLTVKARTSNEIVELLDLYPTVADLAGLPLPGKCSWAGSSNTQCVEGKSLKYLLEKEPGKATMVTKDRYAFSVVTRNDHKVLGYSVRDHKFRYTEWLKFDNKTFCPSFKETLGKELYAIVKDPENNVNVVDKMEYKNAVSKYASLLKVAWGGDCLRSENVPVNENMDRKKRDNNSNNRKMNQGKSALNKFPPKEGVGSSIKHVGEVQDQAIVTSHSMVENKIVLIALFICVTMIAFFYRFKRHVHVRWCMRFLRHL